jgi:predicted DNA-binding protein (MmcQ/YjbR family)
MELTERVAGMKAVIEAMPGAVADGPAVPGARIYKVMGKMFAILSTKPALQSVNIKCDPHLIEILKEQYEGVGHRGHLDRRFWINVRLDADVPAAEVESLVARSYDLVVKSLTKKQQAEVWALAPSATPSPGLEPGPGVTAL